RAGGCRSGLDLDPAGTGCGDGLGGLATGRGPSGGRGPSLVEYGTTRLRLLVRRGARSARVAGQAAPCGGGLMGSSRIIRGDRGSSRSPDRALDGSLRRGAFARVMAASGLMLVLASSARADQPGQPAEGLLRLVPPDATVVLTVEGLRDHARTLA